MSKRSFLIEPGSGGRVYEKLRATRRTGAPQRGEELKLKVSSGVQDERGRMPAAGEEPAGARLEFSAT
jgi:hypothetical protein